MAKYLRYRIKNLEPLRVADDETSQSGQTNAMRYIPGSAIRGLVVNALVDAPAFEELKPFLFSSPTAFLNAYPFIDGNALLPSPKGFYEDKVEAGEDTLKELQNVVINGDFSDGMKRAGLGNFCTLDEECITYYSVKTSSDMRILINPGKDQKRNVFRLETLAQGQCFEGYIRLSGHLELDERIKKLFTPDSHLTIGNARSSGLGSCIVVSSEEVERPSIETEGFDAQGECYLMLLSDTAMRGEEGEYCGLNLPELEKKLGVTYLSISFASTQVRTVHGYNRTRGGKTPTMPVYTAGSVFHLTYTGCITKEKMEALSEEGIGVRREEGFGRVRFLEHYEKIHLKKDGSPKSTPISPSTDQTSAPRLTEHQAETLRTAAKGYYMNVLEEGMEHYVVNHRLHKNGVKNSQLGQVEARLLEYQYNPGMAPENLEGFFEHVEQKERDQKVQKERASLSPLASQVKEILGRPIEETLFEGKSPFKVPGEVMGIPIREFFTQEDDKRYRIKLLIQFIRFDRKGE